MQMELGRQELVMRWMARAWAADKAGWLEWPGGSIWSARLLSIAWASQWIEVSEWLLPGGLAWLGTSYAYGTGRRSSFGGRYQLTLTAGADSASTSLD